MADVTLTPFGFVLIEVGASDGTWGGKTNDNWTLLDGLLDGSGGGYHAKPYRRIVGNQRSCRYANGCADQQACDRHVNFG